MADYYYQIIDELQRMKELCHSANNNLHEIIERIGESDEFTNIHQLASQASCFSQLCIRAIKKEIAEIGDDLRSE